MQEREAARRSPACLLAARPAPPPHPTHLNPLAAAPPPSPLGLLPQAQQLRSLLVVEVVSYFRAHNISVLVKPGRGSVGLDGLATLLGMPEVCGGVRGPHCWACQGWGSQGGEGWGRGFLLGMPGGFGGRGLRSALLSHCSW